MQNSHWLNTKSHFGWISISLHWIMAITLIGMYFLGDYMVDLDYYDTWYHTAPDLHKAIGILLGALLIFRYFWNQLQAQPLPFTSKNSLQTKLARWGHRSLYLLVLLLIISGYLISTAKGKGIDVFGLFEVPALLSNDSERGDLAGEIHEVLATLFILFVAAHALAALFHHFILKDDSLKRMLRRQ